MYKSIQGCRALASLLVVLHHLGTAIASKKYFGIPQFAEPFRSGDSGVEFFFVLSGFIITWVHFNDFGQPQRLASYLRKRAIRIYPTYLIVFSVVYCLALTSASLRSTLPHDYVTLMKTLALLPQSATVVGGSGAPVLLVAWSLQYEMCFYALIAVFVLNRAVGILVCILLFVNWGSCHVAGCSFPRSFFADNLVVLFGFGALIAYVCKNPPRLQRPVIVAAVAAAAFLLYALQETLWGQETFSEDRRIVYGFFSGLAIYALIQAEDCRRLRIENSWIPLLGESSYALYLIHYPLISLLCKALVFAGLAGAAGAFIAYPVILISCICAGTAFHLPVEKPVLRALAASVPSGYGRGTQPSLPVRRDR